MRRNRRGFYDEEDNSKVVLWIAGAILLVAVISFFVVYGIYNSKIESAQLATVKEESAKINVSNSITSSTTNTTAVSSSLGKNVNEVKNSMEKNTINNVENMSQNNNVINNNKANISEENSENKTSTETSKNVVKENEEVNNKVENAVEAEDAKGIEKEEKEPVFQKPLENGEIMREFASENLVYSDTLEEWITHLGIDIKAPKTTVVKAAEAGVVESIKNDPRYGLTIIVKHAKDYKTVYSNLLTTEFVNVGDEVTVGQSLGTVGNSAAFEIADEPHLHFEIIKNGEKVDPNLYIKY